MHWRWDGRMVLMWRYSKSGNRTVAGLLWDQRAVGGASGEACISPTVGLLASQLIQQAMFQLLEQPPSYNNPPGMQSRKPLRRVLQAYQQCRSKLQEARREVG